MIPEVCADTPRREIVDTRRELPRRELDRTSELQCGRCRREGVRLVKASEPHRRRKGEPVSPNQVGSLAVSQVIPCVACQIRRTHVDVVMLAAAPVRRATPRDGLYLSRGPDTAEAIRRGADLLPLEPLDETHRRRASDCVRRPMVLVDEVIREVPYTGAGGSFEVVLDLARVDTRVGRDHLVDSTSGSGGPIELTAVGDDLAADHPGPRTSGYNPGDEIQDCRGSSLLLFHLALNHGRLLQGHGGFLVVGDNCGNFRRAGGHIGPTVVVVEDDLDEHATRSPARGGERSLEHVVADHVAAAEADLAVALEPIDIRQGKPSL